MTNVIEFRKAFAVSGLEFLAESWTLGKLKDLYRTSYSNDSDIENIIDLATRLGIADDQVVLSTYDSKEDRAIYFSVPRVHLNSDGVLCLFMASKLTFPLVYDAKRKTYNVGDLSFAVSPAKTKAGDLVGVNLSTGILKDTAGYDENFTLLLQVKCKSKDLPPIIKALQNNTTLPEKSLVQIGVGSGVFTNNLKPWMLEKGFYKVMSVVYKQITKKDGSGATLREGTVSPVINGVVDESQVFSVAMNSNPFSDQLCSAAKNRAVYFGIDGGFDYDGNVATRGHASPLPEIEPNHVELSTWNKFIAVARRKYIDARRQKPALSDLELAERRALIETPFATEKPPESRELALAGSAAPEDKSLPF